MVDEPHRRADDGVDLRDLTMHLLGDGAVGGMALAAGAQLDDVHRLAGVEVEHVADPVGEAERVRRLRGQALVVQALPGVARGLQRAAVVVAAAGGLDLGRHRGAEVGVSACHWTVSMRWRWRSRKAP